MEQQHLETPVHSSSFFTARDYQVPALQNRTRSSAFRDHCNFTTSISSHPHVPDDRAACVVGAGNKCNNNDGVSDGDSRKSIAERRAATCGFKAEKISTSTPLPPSSSSSSSSSAWLTIPPGISPTALLDSPVMLPDISLPSPTTGTQSLLHQESENSALNSMAPDVGDAGNNAGSSSSFKPDGDPNSRQGFSTSENQGNNCYFLDIMSMESSPDFEVVADFAKEFAENRCNDDLVTNSIIFNDASSNIQRCNSEMPGNQTYIQRATIQGDEVATHHLVQEISPVELGFGRRIGNGYNWTKYEQNQIMGNEYPRSHCNCTHPSCLLKKRMESSYNGAQFHPKAQHSRNALPGLISSLYERTDIDQGIGTYTKLEIDSVWNSIKSGLKDARVRSDKGANGLERTSSPSVITELSNPLSNSQAKTVGTFQAAETPELSSASARNFDDDGATRGGMSVAVVADDEESRSKKRRIDSFCFVETSITSRDAREPRVVVQVESEVDIVDDGYRWRKYGQKVVKGNPNPRSYYKCTNVECSVRKHVERAPHNWKCVIVTYEGKHNHEVPAARNSSHGNSSSSDFFQANRSMQPVLASAINTNAPTLTQNQDLTSGFDGKSLFTTDYWGPNVPGNSIYGAKVEEPYTNYPLKFPVTQDTAPSGSVGLNNIAMPHSSSMASNVPGFPVSLPSNLHAFANLSASSLSIMGNQLVESSPFSSGQHLMMRKPEKVDNICVGTTSLGYVNAYSLSSSSRHQSVDKSPF